MVITSTRLSVNIQRDGRKSVRELHQADGGEFEVREYLAEHDADLDTLLTDNGKLFLKKLATGS